MSKRSFIALTGVAIVVVLATGGLIASNMGFKLNYPLDDAISQGGPLSSGTNTLALPYNQQAGLNNWGDVGNDILGFSPTQVQEISTYVEFDDTFSTYTGAKGQTAGSIVAGEGALVKMGTLVNYIVVGSHNPGISIPLDDAVAQGGPLSSGSNFFAVPYHTTAADTGQLGNDILGFSPTQVQEISSYIEFDDTYSTYTGAKGQSASPIVPGEVVLVKMGVLVNYTPSHY